MGMLRVETYGSFGDSAVSFSAMQHGHAHAVAQAIEFLAATVLPAAIERDHRLHDDNAKPSRGFDRPERSQ